MRRPYFMALRAYPPTYRRRHGDELARTASDMNDGRWSARQSLAFVIGGARRSARTPRRYWGIAAVIPMLYGFVQFMALMNDTSFESPAAWIFKIATVPSIPVLIYLLAERIAERPTRASLSAFIWATLGSVLILVMSRYGAVVSERVSNVASWRIWPGQPLSVSETEALDEIGVLQNLPTVNEIVWREVIVVVLIALLVGGAFRLCTAAPKAAVGLVPITVFGSLVAYKATTPWAFIIDFDFFIGDMLLGAMLAELMFAFAPFDPLGAIGLALASFTMSSMILAWGGAVASEPVAERGAVLRS